MSFATDRPEEKILAKELLELGRKRVSIQARENQGGTYVRITTHSRGYADTIGIPDDEQELDTFIAALQRVRDVLRKGAK